MKSATYGDNAPPALYIHCISIYNKMLESSKKVGAVPEEEMIVYEGFLTHLVSGQSLSVPYYTFCRRALIDMGCIRQIKRGGARAPSQYEMIKAPTEELFKEANPKDIKNDVLGRKGEVNMLKKQITDLNGRVLTLEDFMEAIIKGPK